MAQPSPCVCVTSAGSGPARKGVGAGGDDGQVGAGGDVVVDWGVVEVVSRRMVRKRASVVVGVRDDEDAATTASTANAVVVVGVRVRLLPHCRMSADQRPAVQPRVPHVLPLEGRLLCLVGVIVVVVLVVVIVEVGDEDDDGGEQGEGGGDHVESEGPVVAEVAGLADDVAAVAQVHHGPAETQQCCTQQGEDCGTGTEEALIPTQAA